MGSLINRIEREFVTRVFSIKPIGALGTPDVLRRSNEVAATNLPDVDRAFTNFLQNAPSLPIAIPFKAHIFNLYEDDGNKRSVVIQPGDEVRAFVPANQTIYTTTTEPLWVGNMSEDQQEEAAKVDPRSSSFDLRYAQDHYPERFTTLQEAAIQEATQVVYGLHHPVGQMDIVKIQAVRSLRQFQERIVNIISVNFSGNQEQQAIFNEEKRNEERLLSDATSAGRTQQDMLAQQAIYRRVFS